MADHRPKRGRPESKTPRHKKKPGSKRKRSNRQQPPGSRQQPRLGSSPRPTDPSAAENSETRFLQPYQATKPYLCPGCNQEIPPGMGHIVAVPPDDPDLRRHWHRGCWNNRRNL